MKEPPLTSGSEVELLLAKAEADVLQARVCQKHFDLQLVVVRIKRVNVHGADDAPALMKGEERGIRREAMSEPRQQAIWKSVARLNLLVRACAQVCH